MIRNIFLEVLHFLLIISAQIFILNNIQIFGYINPMLYLWFILMLPINTPKGLVLILSFITGFTVDIFANEMGFHTAVTVFIGFIRHFFIDIYFVGKDKDSFIRPSISEMGIKSFLFYTTVLVLIHHFLYFTLEIFNFSEFLMTLLRIVLSSFATILLITICDLLFIRTNKLK